jgi:cytochrome c biogenesis protein CcmG, thiol:disulfide interchange protein DsbE
MSEQAAFEGSPPPTRGFSFAIRAAAIAAVAALVALLAYGVILKSPNTRIDDNLARHRPVAAPTFELAVLQRGSLGPALSRTLAPALRDGRVALSELRGTPVVLNFWASWCVPCRQEAPLLQRTWRERARPSGVLLLGLDMQDATEDARDFIRGFRVDYLNLRDPDGTIAHRYGATGIPETYFIDRRGRIVGHVIGVTSAAQLRDGMAAATSGEVVGAREGGDERPTR